MTTLARVDRRERIIAAAAKLWQRAHNVNKVSLADIAREAGVSETTVYNNFGTREGLVEETIKYLMETVLARQEGVLKSGLPFPEKIQKMVMAKLTAIAGMEQDLLDRICTDPVVERYVNEIKETRAKPMMQAIIQQGKREGYVQRDLPDEVIMLYFDMLQSGRLGCSEQMQQIIGDRRAIEALTRLIYFGLMQKEFQIMPEDRGRVKKAG